MRNWLFITVSVVLLVSLPGTSWSAQNPGIWNPAGSSTTPRSRIGSGLIRSPNPIDTSGNLVITGNVRRGRHFRGSVPYRASTSFGGTLGSTSLDSFLRDSAGSEDSGRYTEKYRPRPYYSQTGTVTTTAPGHSGVFTPATTKIDGRVPGTSGLKATLQAAGGVNLSMQRQKGILPTQDTKVSDYGLRPVRISPVELERLISDGVAVAGRARRLVDEEDLAQMERLQRDLGQLKNRASDLRQSLIVRDDSLRPFDKLKLDEEALRPSKPQVPKEMTDQEQLDLHKQLRQKLDSLQKALEQIPTVQEQETTVGEEEPGQKRPYFETFRKTGIKEREREKIRGLSREEISELGKVKSLSELQEAKKDVSGSSDADLSFRAKRILREYKTFSSFLKDKFDQHTSAAEIYLKQGRYYQAVDAYTLASIYEPDDPLAYAGKSHALFAAGEYISSALFLSRALKISPEQARVKVDFVAILGDEEKLETRIADVEEWLQRSGAAELEFLLGYVYYQTGKLELAKTAIDAAYKKKPESPTVGAVKKAIYDTIGLK